jgi:hypothetical protein
MCELAGTSKITTTVPVPYPLGAASKKKPMQAIRSKLHAVISAFRRSPVVSERPDGWSLSPVNSFAVDAAFATGICRVLKGASDELVPVVSVQPSSIPCAGKGLFVTQEIDSHTVVALYPGAYVPPLPLCALGAANGEVSLKPGEARLIESSGACVHVFFK